MNNLKNVKTKQDYDEFFKNIFIQLISFNGFQFIITNYCVY